jgi:transketolase
MQKDLVEAFLEHEKEWDKLLSIIDELVDLMLNYRQSGHPGGSRSKMHILLSTMLTGVMRWDVLRPWRPFQDRFVLSAGHTVPAVYATLAAFNEAIRTRFDQDGDPRFAFPDDGRWALMGRDLLRLRRRGGLAGHAEMEGKTLFLKFNTGPSGHGMPPAAGEAMALMRAGAGEVRVFCLEGEGGLTTGAAHETKNSAWGLGLANLVFLIDWNDFGIDARPHSSVVAGTPKDWFAPAGWRVVGTDSGMEWASTVATLADAIDGTRHGVPTAAWFRTRKGRGYGKFDASSHGTPWPLNSPEFWQARERFAVRYGIEYDGAGEPAPAEQAGRAEQAAVNIERALTVLREDENLVRLVTDTLLRIADSVPLDLPGLRLSPSASTDDIAAAPAVTDPTVYPAALWKKPGEMAANRNALTSWGAYVNAYTRKTYGRPLFIVCSADLAASTGIAGFGDDWDGTPGYGWYDRDANRAGVVLPQQITEFTNAGLMAGLASVNLSSQPMDSFDGFWGACSTYGSFTYLAYGPLRLFSQLAQDSQIRVGKVLFVAGHSGPETAEDSRTHFGIYEPGIMQLFPRGQVVDLHPWEHNEVAVMLATALRTDAPVIALNLTRPAIEVPDRTASGIDSHFAAAKGAYLLRDYDAETERAGTIIVRGTVPTANVVKLLPEFARRGYNIKVVAAVSWALFARQDDRYRHSILSVADRSRCMVITNGALRWMSEWTEGGSSPPYSLSPEHHNRWLTGGSLDEVMEEAGLSRAQILEAVDRFVRNR